METQERGKMAGKVISCVIVALIIAGTAFTPFVSSMEQGSGIIATLFIGFLCAIIALQVVPGLMLFGLMVKGIASLMRKETVPDVRAGEAE